MWLEIQSASHFLGLLLQGLCLLHRQLCLHHHQLRLPLTCSELSSSNVVELFVSSTQAVVILLLIVDR